MTFFEQCITIALCILASVLTRALPFLFLTGNKPAPPLVRYVLPAAVFGMLVVYCLKDTSFLRADYGLPELIGIAVTAILHIRLRQMLISMAGGTIVYMLLVQLIFPH